MQWKLVFTNSWFSLIKCQELRLVWAVLWEATQAQSQSWELLWQSRDFTFTAPSHCTILELGIAVAGQGFHLHCPFPLLLHSQHPHAHPGAVSILNSWDSAPCCCGISFIQKVKLGLFPSCLRKINLFGSLSLSVYAANILIKHWGKNKIRLLISKNWTFSFYSYT